MSNLSMETVLEIEYRLKENALMRTAFDPETAIPERKAWSYDARAASYYGQGEILRLLGRISEAELVYKKVIPHAQSAIAVDLFEKEDYRQYSLFVYALLLGNKTQADESALVISKLGISQSRLDAPSELYVTLAALWLGEMEIVGGLIPILEHIEQKKNEKFVLAGFTLAIKGIIARDEVKSVKGLETIIEQHIHQVKYLRYALNHSHFVCQQATILCILALRYGMDLKSEIEGEVTTLKTKMLSPIDRPEIPEKTKFEVPVDLIPEWILAPWRKKFKNELNN